MRKMLLYALSGVAVSILADTSFKSWMPFTWWGEYDSVVYQGHNPDGGIDFVSNAIVRRPVERSWKDILFCDQYDGRGYRYFSHYPSGSVKVEGSKALRSSVWTYQAKVPSRGDCYLRSEITYTVRTNLFVQLKFEKTEVYEGKPFSL
ncbi:MAG: hypothetical protein AAF468_20680 [Pseudomonadota bacterium]